MIRIQLFISCVFCSVFLIYFTNHAQAQTFIPNDSSKQINLSSSYSFRVMFGAAGEVFQFYKLGMRVPFYKQPAISGNQKSTISDASLMVGLGYRNINAIFRTGPYIGYEGFTTEDEYAKSASLELTDQRQFFHYSIELSHTWKFGKSPRNLFLLEIAPLVGYAYFMRKYDGEIQDLKSNKKILDYHDRVVSKGI